MTIPTEIEKDIKSGVARYRTYQTGIGGQSVLGVPPNSYIIIFGYTYNPMGSGIIGTSTGANTFQEIENDLLPFLTQQVSFWNGENFYPFIHHVPMIGRFLAATTNRMGIDTRPFHTSTYMVCKQNVAITVGLLGRFNDRQTSQINVTNNTPIGLTYGGSGCVNRRTTFQEGPGPNLNRFYQPNDVPGSDPAIDYYQDGAGAVPPPSGADDQFYTVPVSGVSATAGPGLISPAEYLEYLDNTYGAPISTQTNAAIQYYLTCHYAIYTERNPSQI
tara:strand:+ start:191 stop:1012 length:822 start_codon:yes stop_codon:yes gene_type:complete